MQTSDSLQGLETIIAFTANTTTNHYKHMLLLFLLQLLCPPCLQATSLETMAENQPCFSQDFFSSLVSSSKHQLKIWACFLLVESLQVLVWDLQTRSVMIFTSQQAQNEQQEDFITNSLILKEKTIHFLRKKLFL